MGTGYDCGCRHSGGGWYPCRKHELMLMAEIMKDERGGKRPEKRKSGVDG